MIIKIGEKTFNSANKTFVMGILNITPDSFFDGGKFNSHDAALKQFEKLVNEGADIVDIGAESTRPGFTPISTDEELKRFDDLIFKIKKRFNTPVSIDTTKAKVAELTLQQGADLINDVSFAADITMIKIVAKFNSAYCLMHNKKTRKTSCFLKELIENLKLKLKIVENCGVAKNKIIIDPGIGFNKTLEENLLAIKHIPQLLKLNFPVLVGASNKSFIGHMINKSNSCLRLSGTIATSTISAFLGANFIRVHDVKANIDAVTVASRIKNLNLA